MADVTLRDIWHDHSSLEVVLTVQIWGDSCASEISAVHTNTVTVESHSCYCGGPKHSRVVAPGAEIRPRCGKIGRVWSNYGRRIGPHFGQRPPSLPTIQQIPTNVSRIRPASINHGPSLPILVDTCQVWGKAGQRRLNFCPTRPLFVEFGPKVGSQSNCSTLFGPTTVANVQFSDHGARTAGLPEVCTCLNLGTALTRETWLKRGACHGPNQRGRRIAPRTAGLPESPWGHI